jgi:hypothetical protein
MLTRVDPLTMERLVGEEDQAAAAAAADPAAAAAPGAAVGAGARLPPVAQRLGALQDWWEAGDEAGVAPWAASLDLALLPGIVDTDALVLTRQLQLQQHHAEVAALSALAGTTVGFLGSSGNAPALAAAAATATAHAHVQLQQQLQAAMAADAAVLARRQAQEPAGAAAVPGSGPPAMAAVPGLVAGA